MVINVSEALDSDTSEIITVKRTLAGGYIDGIYQESLFTTFKTICSVQQPSGSDMKRLRGGQREDDVKKFISKKSLRTVNEKGQTLADVVLYKGNNYQIKYAENWSAYGHTTALGVKVLND